MKKKILAMTLAAVMAVSLAACGGGKDGSGDSGNGGGASGDGVNITIFNSKIEVQEQFEEMAKEYSEKTEIGRASCRERVF